MRKCLNNFCDTLWLWQHPKVYPRCAISHRYSLLQPYSEIFSSSSLSLLLPKTPLVTIWRHRESHQPANVPYSSLHEFPSKLLNQKVRFYLSNDFFKKRQLKVTWWEKGVRKFYSLDGFVCWSVGQSCWCVCCQLRGSLGHGKLITVLLAPWEVSPLTTDICLCVHAHFSPLLSGTPSSAGAWRGSLLPAVLWSLWSPFNCSCRSSSS